MKVIKILVVDDERDINEIITISLREAGFEAVGVYNLKDARVELESGIYSLVILDLNLPDGDGVELLSEIKGRGSKIPVVLLTAKSEYVDIELGLEAGADDYLVKPFRGRELVLRCKNIIDRVGKGKSIYSYKNLSVNTDMKSVYIGKEIVNLSNKEYKLLLLLVSNMDTLMSRIKIYESIWGVIEEPDYHRLESTISNLRRKLREVGFDGIKTNYMSGYYLE